MAAVLRVIQAPEDSYGLCSGVDSPVTFGMPTNMRLSVTQSSYIAHVY